MVYTMVWGMTGDEVMVRYIRFTEGRKRKDRSGIHTTVKLKGSSNKKQGDGGWAGLALWMGFFASLGLGLV